MILLFFAYVLWFPAIAGYGIGILRLARIPSAEIRDDPAFFAIVGSLGLMALSAIAIVINWGFPISGWVSTGIWFAGYLLLIPGFAGRGFIPIRAGVLVFGAVALLMGYLAWRPLLQYDDGLYHLQAIGWIEQVRTPLGLANLHARFGYNSSWDVLGAVVRVPGLPYSGPQVLNPLVAIMFASAAGVAIKNVFVSTSPRLSDLFLSLTAIPLGWRVIASPDLASASNDPPAALMTFLALYLVARGVERSDERKYEFMLALLIATFALTIKLSTAPLFLGVLTVFAVSEGVRGVGPLICFAALVPWAARGILLSGCLAFPSGFAHFEALSWAVPSSELIKESEWIRSWARRPGLDPHEVLRNSEWLGPWARAFITKETMLLTILGISGAILLMGIRRNRDAVRPHLVPLAISLIGAILWFFSAPDLRFGYGYLYSIALLVFAAGIREALANLPVQMRRIGLGAVALLLIATVFYAATARSLGGPGPMRLKAVALFSLPALPEPQLIATAIDGLDVWHPDERDQCWAGDLPCAPFVPKGLRFKRAEGSLPWKFWIEAEAPAPIPRR